LTAPRGALAQRSVAVTGPDGTVDTELIAEVEHWSRHRS
jgi:hypothetical protein